jgi:hypothetical protein
VGGGEISGNVARENSCYGLKRHMMAQKLALLCTFFASKQEEDGKRGNVLAMMDSMCQSAVMEGVWRAVTTTKESPSREKFLR